MMALTWGLLALPSLLAGAQAMTAAGAAAIAGSYVANIKVYVLFLFVVFCPTLLTQQSVRNSVYALDAVDVAEIETRPKVEAYVAKKVAAGTNNNCTLETAAVRREWADLSVTEREEYVAAVTC